MKTNVSATSLDAHRQIVAANTPSQQEGEILAFLAQHPAEAFTRNEIAEAIGMRVASVCGRCNTMVKRRDVVEGPRRLCRVTGFGGHVIQIAATAAKAVPPVPPPVVAPPTPAPAAPARPVATAKPRAYDPFDLEAIA